MNMKNDDKYSELYQTENDNRVKTWEDIGEAVIEADLKNTGRKYVGNAKNQKLAWLWLEYKQQEREKNAKKFSLKQIIYDPWIIGIGAAIIAPLLIYLSRLYFLNDSSSP